MLSRRDIKFVFIVTKRRVKSFLLSPKSREFFIFLFFFFVASGFWLLQTLKNDFQTEVSIPVKLRNVSSDVIVTSDIPSALKVTLKDKGTVLLNYLLAQSFYPVSIDFKDYQNKGNQVKVLSWDLDKKISSQLNSSTALIEIKPDTIDLIYVQGKAKVLPVKLLGEVTPSRQYYLTDTIFRPDSVTVYAPDQILDTMQCVYTEYIRLENLSDTLRQNLNLARTRGVKIEPPTTQVTFPVEVITESTLEIPLIPVDFPKDRVLRTFPSRVNVTFQVGINRLRTINPEDFVLLVPYEDIVNNKTDKYRLTLSAIPNGVSHVRIFPQEIDYLIEQHSLHETP